MNEMSDKAKAAKAAYQREWRKRNPDKVKQYVKNHWERKAAELENKDITDTDIPVTPVTDSLSVTTCANCGNSFTAKRADAKFCSDKCRVQFNRKIK